MNNKRIDLLFKNDKSETIREDENKDKLYFSQHYTKD